MNSKNLNSFALWALAFFMTASFFACNGGNKIEFIDQDLTGKIDGNDWTIGSGTAAAGFSSDEMSIDIYSVLDTNACDFDTPGGDRVLFSIDKAVGYYELKFGTQTVTLFGDANSTNTIAVSGAVEILSIDEAAGTVTGRMDVAAGSSNELNGNFTLTWCP